MNVCEARVSYHAGRAPRASCYGCLTRWKQEHRSVGVGTVMSTVVPGGKPPEPGTASARYAVVPRMLPGSHLLRQHATQSASRLSGVGFEIRASRSKISRLEAGKVKFTTGHGRHWG